MYFGVKDWRKSNMIWDAREPVFSSESGRVVHVLYGKICLPLDVSC